MQNKALDNRQMNQEKAKYLNCGKLCIPTGTDLYFVRHACIFLGIPKKTVTLRDLLSDRDYLVHATQYLSIMRLKNAKYINL